MIAVAGPVVASKAIVAEASCQKVVVIPVLVAMILAELISTVAGKQTFGGFTIVNVGTTQQVVGLMITL